MSNFGRGAFFASPLYLFFLTVTFGLGKKKFSNFENFLMETFCRDENMFLGID
jgi:hypothetical protein